MLGTALEALQREPALALLAVLDLPEGWLLEELFDQEPQVGQLQLALL
jgi:hypothetical protein